MLILSHDKIYEVLRTLAKKDYWQSLYIQSKELSAIKIFSNNKNFTYLQMYFLNQLSFYNSLNMDIAMGDVSEIVLDNEIFEDAYIYYRNRKRRNKQKKIDTPVVKTDEAVVGHNQWVFTKVKGK